MRPLYETSKDFENEKNIQNVIEEKTSWRLTKLPKRYYLDFLAFNSNGNTEAVIEVKRRHNNHDKYEDVILSLAKYMQGLEYATTLGVAFLFAVEFNDGYYIHFSSSDNLKHFKITMGGRRDRQDPEDIEPVVHIPITTGFTSIKTIEL
tara:strand:- start:537 stop:983 length:447 start_codon:yes stop_codon:yes gene_type:complete